MPIFVGIFIFHRYLSMDVANGLVQFADVAQVWQDKANELVTTKVELYKNYPNIQG